MSKFTARQRINLQLALIKGSLLSYSRDRAAVFFTLLFPLIFMVIFGLLNFGGDNSSAPNVGIVDNADNTASNRLVAVLSSDEVPLEVSTFATEAEGRDDIGQGDTDVLLTIPSGFTLGADVPDSPAQIAILYQADQAIALSIVSAVLASAIDSIVLDTADERYISENYVTLGAPKSVSTAGTLVTYRVFLIPGILAMAIMQTGVFGIVFTLVRFKVSGVLRRFQGTPAGIAPFLFSEMTARLIIIVVSTAILMGIGAALFSDYRAFLTENGFFGIFSTLVVAVLGGFLFVGFGLAISGRTRSENAAAGIANLSTFPMLFLSGVFFSTDVLPDWLQSISRFLPLTFLIEAMREIQIDGASLVSASVGLNVLGLLTWGSLFFVLARLLFRWK